MDQINESTIIIFCAIVLFLRYSVLLQYSPIYCSFLIYRGVYPYNWFYYESNIGLTDIFGMQMYRPTRVKLTY